MRLQSGPARAEACAPSRGAAWALHFASNPHILGPTVPLLGWQAVAGSAHAWTALDAA